MTRDARERAGSPVVTCETPVAILYARLKTLFHFIAFVCVCVFGWFVVRSLLSSLYLFLFEFYMFYFPPVLTTQSGLTTTTTTTISDRETKRFFFVVCESSERTKCAENHERTTPGHAVYGHENLYFGVYAFKVVRRTGE